MSEEIKLHKKVFNKAQYSKIIDTTFSELGATTIQEEIDALPNIEEFFSLYNQLFYDIPEFGEINSHEFLIQQSSAYIDFNANTELIDDLQNEISQLRTELLNSQRRVIELETGEILSVEGLDELPSAEDLTSSATEFTGGTSGGAVSGGGSSGGGGGGY